MEFDWLILLPLGISLWIGPTIMHDGTEDWRRDELRSLLCISTKRKYFITMTVSRAMLVVAADKGWAVLPQAKSRHS